ncbi:MAG: pantetheine-phosphate adenylyltransferase [SAR324 cluster bacterium]|nr:pantetheine-phosphate adenylyltransferase [SAR324 cluster bacterium]
MTNKTIAIYPISAQPPTWGHGDIIRRAANLYGHVYWVAAHNAEKQQRLPLTSQISIMQDYIDYYKLNNVTLDHFSGSIARYAMDKGARVILRGLRHSGDFEGEASLAAGYRSSNENLELVALFSKPEYSRVSSSLVRELVRIGEPITDYVLPATIEKIEAAFGPKT